MCLLTLSYTFYFLHLNTGPQQCDIYTERDIDGASLAGRHPNKLTKQEYKFWLDCRAIGHKTLANLLKRHSPGRTRSSEQHLLVIPRTKLTSFGDRCFRVVGPRSPGPAL